MNRIILTVLVAVATITLTPLASPAGEQAMRIDTSPGLGGYDVPFLPNASYRDGIQSPEEFLGFPLGARPASNEEIIRYYEYLAETLPNAQLHDYATSYEGRRLVYLVVGSPGHMERLDDIRNNLAGLADPRRIRDKDAVRLIEQSPAVAWMGYGIHGDELSSCDAALQLAYQLLAGTDEESKRIMDNVIVIIDPSQNPDGHTRWLGQLQQWGSVVPSHDTQSLQHRGFWPQGRTNHYLFDLNRDWFARVHPESRGRTTAVLEWMPHYFLDCHEMGPADTYLFSPPRAPFNPYMTDYIHKWWKLTAEEHAAAFDRYGWAYYTREWNEEFFPGYGSSWSIYLGAVGMLFEQAGVDGSLVKRPEGTVMTYRETVHHQFIGSLAQLLAVANNRKDLLTDYYEQKLRNVRSRGGAFLFPPSANATRLQTFATNLQQQNIEIERATKSFRAGRVNSSLGEAMRSKELPAGTLIVRTNQPLKQLIDVILTFDIRIESSFLEIEKKEILKNHRTKLYESTGWSLPLAYGLEAYYAESAPRVDTEPFAPTPPRGGVTQPGASVGYVWDGTDDRACQLLEDLLSAGVEVRAARRRFEVNNTVYPRGSFLVRHSDNPDLDVEQLEEMAVANGVQLMGVSAALGRPGYADFGGDDFRLLEAPRIALVGGSPVAYYDFGAIWHLLDSRFQARTTTLDVSYMARADLSRYNVIVLPHSWGGATGYKNALGEVGVRKLKDWVRDGGTLVSEGTGSAFLADSSVAITSVRVRRQVLGELSLYEDALTFAREANNPTIDSLDVWEARTSGEAPEEAEDKTPLKRLKQRDEIARRLFPRGAIVTVDLDDEHWLAYGCGSTVPVLFNSNYAYLAKGNVQVPGRLAPADRLRLSGLFWPEARDRWASTAYVTREQVGRGQVICFATLPNFRGYFRGAERVLINALLLGPGLGARQSIGW